jgi:hypothetical protein
VSERRKREGKGGKEGRGKGKKKRTRNLDGEKDVRVREEDAVAEYGEEDLRACEETKRADGLDRNESPRTGRTAVEGEKTAPVRPGRLRLSYGVETLAVASGGSLTANGTDEDGLG